ncbi:NAD(P)-binding protein [Choiromyces venosus 120613-1]|uniref:D-xylose 1-dehydrogenase (NADP(+), D-xylono-1,5-lactone-forming) n=1 Tax=Choiromyces venosus 120613-1 TaxID=1336337 RepID=A0A3N4KAR1_9PEZI|nr:NAD(P)-binding protein [Choiromyces venosus 120613-1]
MIASWFVSDLVLERGSDARAKHIIQVIGPSSETKGKGFVEKYYPNSAPKVYGSYEAVYADPDVDCVYTATLHAFHHKNMLDTIAAGKNILCEKPVSINAREAEDMVKAAREKGFFLMEVLVDFGLEVETASLPPDSCLKNLALGAGALLDIGIYSRTWSDILLNPSATDTPVISANTIPAPDAPIDLSDVIVMSYPRQRAQAILTCTLKKGSVVVYGPAASSPSGFVVTTKGPGKVWKCEYERAGGGFYYEADEVALDLAEGRKENGVMRLEVSLRMMRLMDEVRRQGGVVYPQGKA